jgi:transitional endoplasmic reticulum ATPase
MIGQGGGKGAVLPPGMRRRRLIELMDERLLTLKEPRRDTFIQALAQRTEGFVGSDLEALCREAGMLALRSGADTVTLRHFEEAEKKVHPTMNNNLRGYYDKIRQHFKGGLPKQVQPPEYQ